MNERRFDTLEDVLLPVKQSETSEIPSGASQNAEPLHTEPLVEQGSAATAERGTASAAANTTGTQPERTQLNVIQAAAVAVKTTLVAVAQVFWWSLRLVVGYLRHHPLHAMFNLALLALFGLVLVTGSRIYEDVILTKISEDTIDRLIDASVYTRDFNSNGIRDRGTEEFLRVGAPEWTQRESIKAVLYHARRAGLSPLHQAALLATVEIESGFNPAARAPTTTACGLFQFVRKTGLVYGLQPSECMNPWLNAKAGVAHYVDNYNARVDKRVKDLTDDRERLFKTFELTYYLHHDGPLSSNPQNDVKAVVLTATSYALRAYNILLEEYRVRNDAPKFASIFAGEFWDLLSAVGFELSNTVQRIYKRSSIDLSTIPDEVAPYPVVKPEDPEVSSEQQELFDKKEKEAAEKKPSRAEVKLR